MAKSKKRKKKYRRLSDPSATFAKRTILVVIIILAIAVITTLISALFYDNKKIIKKEIIEMTKDYYEKYFYEQLVNSEQHNQPDTFKETMDKYHTGALNTLTLRDLLTYDDGKFNKYEKHLSEYCDIDTTTVRIFPYEPYSRTTYHAEFTYSCNF